MAKDKTADNRSKTWCVILYPDDLPVDWQLQLQLLGVQTVISPLHDQDLNADGSAKKAHHHVLLLFTSKKSAQQLKTMFAQKFGTSQSGSIIGVANISDACMVHDRRAMVRYLCHLDNPEKAQYSTEDLIPLNGADINSLLIRSMNETQEVLKEIMAFIDQNDITEFYTLAKWSQHRAEWFLVVTSKATVFLNHYIRSRRHSKAAAEDVKPIVDTQTGEVLNLEELEETKVEGGAADV